MSTKNPRINLTVDSQIASILATIAKKQELSVSRLAKELILDALERHEDYALSQLAEKREIKRQKRVSHEQAWK